jgi:two-component sensor histidine kinase
VVFAALTRWCFSFISSDIFIFAAFYPAVLFATYVGGAAVGIYAAMLGGIIAASAFMPHPLTSGVEIKLLAYVFASSLIIWGADHYRKLTKRVEDEEKFRKLAVDELAHRLKNKLATIQSIVSFQLREEPQVRDAILKRLGALSATDDLLMAAQGNGANIRDIVSAELAPYEASRISIDGPDCILSPKLALTAALLVHELATNAAKYGALSNSLGKLLVHWAVSSGRLSFEWRESDGPIVATPTHRGFGTRLLSQSMSQFGGGIETIFNPTGLVCKMSVAVPEASPVIATLVPEKMSAVLAAD